MTQSDTMALQALRWMASFVPPTGSDVVKQTLRVWPVLHIGDKLAHYMRAREVCECLCPELGSERIISDAEVALEAQSRLFLS